MDNAGKGIRFSAASVSEDPDMACHEFAGIKIDAVCLVKEAASDTHGLCTVCCVEHCKFFPVKRLNSRADDR